MNRIDFDELSHKAPYVVPRADFESDRARGFTVLEHEPERVLQFKNPRRPEHVIEKQLPAVHLFRCMFCQFDTVESAYPPDPETKQQRTGLDLIRKHLDAGQHPWPYNAFETPYGNVQDVKIEGVEGEYQKEITHG